jgi:uncharacterized protein HemY
MNEIFGMSTNQLMVFLLIVFGVGVVVIGAVALRNRVILKMAVRNIPRRRAQTALIVLGLMLATLLFSASFRPILRRSGRACRTTRRWRVWRPWPTRSVLLCWRRAPA